MKLTLTTAAAVLALSATSVFAEPGLSLDTQVQMLMKQAEAQKTAPAPAAAAVRTAKIGADITVTIKSKITTPVSCSLTIVHGTALAQYVETVAVPLKITNKTGTCAPVIPFKWANADTSFPVMVSLQVSTMDETASIGRVSQHSIQQIQLPNQNQTKTITYSLDF